MLVSSSLTKGAGILYFVFRLMLVECPREALCGVRGLAFTRFSYIRNVRPDSGRFAIVETVLAVVDIDVGSIRYKLFHSTVFGILNKPASVSATS